MSTAHPKTWNTILKTDQYDLDQNVKAPPFNINCISYFDKMMQLYILYWPLGNLKYISSTHRDKFEQYLFLNIVEKTAAFRATLQYPYCLAYILKGRGERPD